MRMKALYRVSDDDRLPLALVFLFLLVVAQFLLNFRQFSLITSLLILLFGMYVVWNTRNSFGAAHLFAAFFSAADVYFRMTKSGMPVEFGKETASLLLLFGLLLERRFKAVFLLFIAYFVLLLPGMYPTFLEYDFSHARYLVTNDLSGPFLIVIAGCYFFERKLTDQDFVRLSRFFLFGVIIMSLHVFFKVGDYTSIAYSVSSNASSSGGFAGTQVSPVFGAGILVLLVNLIQGRTIMQYKAVDLLLLFIFLLQGLFTFSRGGMLSAFLAFAISFVVTQGFSPRKILLTFVLPGTLLFMSFLFVDDITGGKIYQRYFNVDKQGYIVKEDYSTGREDIVEADLNTFLNNPYTGVGIGLSARERLKTVGYALSSHDEYSRALADHGILGAAALLILLSILLLRFFQIHDNRTRFVFLSFILFALLMMLHGGLRSAFYSYLFGLAFVTMQQYRRAPGKEKV